MNSKDNCGDNDIADSSLASSRSRRSRSDKQGRFAALEKLKGLKGLKHKYEVGDVSNVYDEVDEKEYSKRRQDRMEDNFIIDDDGSGYVEDGREVFDEDMGDDSLFLSRKDKKHKGKTCSDSVKRGGGNIKNMLINMPAKKKKLEGNVRLDQDELLDDILQDLDNHAPIHLPHPRLLQRKMKTSLTKSPVKPLCSQRIVGKLKPLKSLASLNGAGNSDRLMENKMDLADSQKVEEFDTLDFDFSNDMEDENLDTEIKEFDEKLDAQIIEVMPTSAVSSSTEKGCFLPAVSKSIETCDNRGFAARAEFDLSQLTTGWETVKGEVKEADASIEVKIDSTDLPLTENADGEQVLKFFWIDAHEDAFKHPGTIYLFGKVWIEYAKIHVSCCITVRNIQRRVFFLPREKRMNLKTREETCDLTMNDVYQEVNSKVIEKNKIREFKSREVMKRYAFEKYDVPNEAEYLEVRYSAEFPTLPSELEGETFSHVFGTRTSDLELFLLERRIKGPCWLEVKMPQVVTTPSSWCKVEAVALNPCHLSPIAGQTSPPMVVMSIKIQTTINPRSHQNEATLISCLVHSQFPIDKLPPQPLFEQHFCIMTHPSDVPWPWDLKDFLPKYRSTKIDKVDTERALLGLLLAKIQKLDPDIIAGHDLVGFDLSILLHRLSANKIPHWSRVGRLKRLMMPKLSSGKGHGERTAFCGRLICDVKISAKELIRAKSYDLATLVGQVLRISEGERKDLTLEDAKKMFDSSATLLQLVTMTMQDAFYVLRLMSELNILPLALQITCIAGFVMSRTLLGGRSERNEFLLLHAFEERHFIVPDKQYGKHNQKAIVHAEDGDEEGEGGGGARAKIGKGRRKPTYAGGLVLEPKKGFYDTYILLMDFNSLYPSIIQEYNICFTTMPREALHGTSEEEGDATIPNLPEPDQQMGVLPTEIRKLVESRRQVKNLMKQSHLSNDLKLQYDIRQKALKLTANSMYGCLGFSYSRFFARHLAALVTAKGREILLQTRDLVQKLNFEVIYGDTDSIMINTNCSGDDIDQVFKLGQKIKTEVNKLYKQLELDVDGVFKYMLLLKKKKYAALTVTKLPSGQTVFEQELKGLDIVRRDWSQLACDVGRFIINEILSDKLADERIQNIHSHLEMIKEDLENNKVTLEELAITKQLTKNPEDYPDMKSLPHVQVALRMNSRGGKKLRQGDTVSYVICEDGSNLAATQRAYHIEELKSNTALSIDKTYYLAHQVHPVVSRLCDPIEGTDSARIAQCLGLDEANYRSSKQFAHRDDEDDMQMSEVSDEERYRMCDRFSFNCPAADCGTIVVVDSVFKGVSSNVEVSLEKCPNPKCCLPLYSRLPFIINQLKMNIRKHITKYYDGWLICEDPGCSNRTRRIPLCFSRGFPICNVCERGILFREYTESQLYKQLCFYDHIFDLQKACQKNKDERIRDDNLRKVYNMLQMEVQKALKLNAYSEVNLTKLFSSLFVKPQSRGL